MSFRPFLIVHVANTQFLRAMSSFRPGPRSSPSRGYKKPAADSSALALSAPISYSPRLSYARAFEPSSNILSLTVILVASEAIAASNWPQRSNLTSDLKSATSITLVSMCMLTLMAILVASEAIAASKRPRRSHLSSELKSVTSITHVAMLIWPLKASMS